MSKKKKRSGTRRSLRGFSVKKKKKIGAYSNSNVVQSLSELASDITSPPLLLCIIDDPKKKIDVHKVCEPRNFPEKKKAKSLIGLFF